MSFFSVTLLLFREKQTPASFLTALHRKLESISLAPDIDDQEFIVFNDTRSGQEKEHVDLHSSMQVQEVIDLLCSWPGLGLLSYRHPDFSFPITLNYHTWDDEHLQGITIGFNGHEASSNMQKKDQLVAQVMQLVEYQYVVDDIDHSSCTYIDLSEDLATIIRTIEARKSE